MAPNRAENIYLDLCIIAGSVALPIFVPGQHVPAGDGQEIQMLRQSEDGGTKVPLPTGWVRTGWVSLNYAKIPLLT